MKRKVVVFDLDDTLYKEIDYLKSGYRKVSELVAKRFGLDAHEVYANLLSWYNLDKNPFETLNETYQIDNPISDYLNVYRYHQPLLMLSSDVANVLTSLKNRGDLMGIISDGRKETQENKIKALGLLEWIAPELILINEKKEYFKPNRWSFDRIMLKCLELNVDSNDEFYYIGDNLEKDFLAPNQIGWITACLKDDGRNIHKQNFNLRKEYLPQHTINNIIELIDLIR